MISRHEHSGHLAFLSVAIASICHRLEGRLLYVLLILDLLQTYLFLFLISLLVSIFGCNPNYIAQFFIISVDFVQSVTTSKK